MVRRDSGCKPTKLIPCQTPAIVSIHASCYRGRVDETKLRHLEAIQAVIARQANNSFALKALTGTITAAVVAYSGATTMPAPWMPVAGVLPALVFWIMDAKYLQQERQFRELYEAVRLDQIEELFSMNVAEHGGKVDSVVRIAFSWSVIWFYFVNVVVVAATTRLG